MDPQYEMLRKFLGQAAHHLNEEGVIFLGFSYTMGDTDLLQEIAK